MQTAGGPAQAFDDVYRRNAGSVYRFCLSQVRDPGAAEDLAGDVFASAFAAYEHAHPDPDGVRPWLFRIARNAVIDHHRRARLRRFTWLRREASDGADLEAGVILREEVRAAIDAIAHLRARDRRLVGLRVAGGLSYAEVGAVMAMTENAARMATQRALHRVRDQLGDPE